MASSPEYRAGWALAWYQWRRNEPMEAILAGLSCPDLLHLALPARRSELAAFGQAVDALRAKAREGR